MSQEAVLGGGCFWCVEAVIQRLKGVQKVQPGYAGGKELNLAHKQICSGKSGYAQVVRVQYNPQIISYKDLIYIFMMNHDPTAMKRQKYRSIILYKNQQQLEIIKQILIDVQQHYTDKIMTELSKMNKFYTGEQKHHNYYIKNKEATYCQTIIKPKIQKLQNLYSKYLNKQA